MSEPSWNLATDLSFAAPAPASPTPTPRLGIAGTGNVRTAGRLLQNAWIQQGCVVWTVVASASPTPPATAEAYYATASYIDAPLICPGTSKNRPKISPTSSATSSKLKLKGSDPGL